MSNNNQAPFKAEKVVCIKEVRLLQSYRSMSAESKWRFQAIGELLAAGDSTLFIKEWVQMLKDGAIPGTVYSAMRG